MIHTTNFPFKLYEEESLKNDLLYDISTAIFKSREKSGMSKTDFAEMLGVSRLQLAGLESGEDQKEIEPD